MHAHDSCMGGVILGMAMDLGGVLGMRLQASLICSLFTLSFFVSRFCTSSSPLLSFVQFRERYVCLPFPCLFLSPCSVTIILDGQVGAETVFNIANLSVDLFPCTSHRHYLHHHLHRLWGVYLCVCQFKPPFHGYAHTLCLSGQLFLCC
jgi:hypothetical protein